MKLKVNQHYTLPSDLDYLLNINVTTVDSGWNFNKFKKKKSLQWLKSEFRWNDSGSRNWLFLIQQSYIKPGTFYWRETKFTIETTIRQSCTDKSGGKL